MRFNLEIDTDMMHISPEDICKHAEAFFNEYKSDYLDKFDDRNIKTLDIKTPVIIGGGAGYATKTSMYSIYEDKKAALKTIQKIMVNTTSTRKQRDPHKHYDDSHKYRVSPHIRKCTRYDGQLYDIGICNMTIDEMN